MRHWLLWTLVGFGLLACDGDSKDTTDTDTDTDEETDTETESDTETDTTDTDAAALNKLQILRGWEGEGTLTDVGTEDAAYEGSETWYAIGEVGNGTTYCEISYDLVDGTSADPECTTCDWAFDMTIANATIVTSDGPGCGVLFGYDEDNVDELNGTQRHYGFEAEYVGHANALYYRPDTKDGSWNVVADGVYDAKAGTFAYNFQNGLLTF